MGRNIDPLPSSFMVISIIGCIITAVYSNSGKLDIAWALSFLIVFSIMFIASIISMTKAPIEAEIQIDQIERKRASKK